MSSAFLLFSAVAIGGGALMLRALGRPRRLPADIASYLRTVPAETFPEPLEDSFSARVFAPVAGAVVRRIERFAPRQYLDGIDRQLAQAGLVGRRRAAEHVAMQFGLASAGLLVVVGLVLPSRPSSMLAGAALLIPVMGFLLPSARLKKQIRLRSDAIFRDLPDIIDMLAIAVEAGCGFEAALSLVCGHFDSPLTDDLSFALREMELGLSRKQAFQQLKERTDLDVVRTFALALLQADALGIPIGRVLKAQATEVRARRRAWAREKAAKLPVKILFPLVAFVFPPILAIVLGPAAMSFGQLGH